MNECQKLQVALGKAIDMTFAAGRRADHVRAEIQAGTRPEADLIEAEEEYSICRVREDKVVMDLLAWVLHGLVDPVGNGRKAVADLLRALEETPGNSKLRRALTGFAIYLRPGLNRVLEDGGE